jgi:quinolinate synthase
MINVNDIRNFGFLKMDIPKGIDLKKEIKVMCREKNAIILAHYYQTGDIQDIADFVGDSLALAQNAEKTKADIILFCGVHFMAETAKILCPEKKVLLPDTKAGCSLAESCPPIEFKKFKESYTGYTVISYVNTSAEIKALTDIICTSSNAMQIINSLPSDEKILFAPDRNLGNYIQSQAGREMVIWDGACHVHEEFSIERILELKKEYSDAKIIAHPECKKPVLLVSDFIGSTAALLKFVQISRDKTFIVATESGILHQMIKACPDKKFIAAPPIDSTCGCNDCNFMKLNSIEKMYNTLKYEMPEIIVKEDIGKKAYFPIKRMLDISAKLGL